jgi:hypothetical protein
LPVSEKISNYNIYPFFQLCYVVECLIIYACARKDLIKINFHELLRLGCHAINGV